LVIVMQIGALIVNILAISLKVLSIMSDISPVVMNVRRLSKRRRCDRPETGSNSVPSANVLNRFMEFPFLNSSLASFRSMPD